MSLDFLNEASFLNLATIGSFLFIVIIVVALGWLVARFARDPVRDRLEAIARSDQAEAPASGEASAFSESLARQLPQTRIDNGKLDRELRQAGFYKPSARWDFLALRNGLVILVIIVTGVLVVALGPDREALVFRVLIGGLIFAALLWAIPRLYLRAIAAQRVDRIRNALPDALDIATMCLSGGIPLRDALVRVSHEIVESHPDLAVELVIIRQQSELSSLDDAFEQFANRIEAPETTALATLIAEGMRLGTSLVETILEFADGMRLKRRQLADERAGRVSVQLLFPVVFCLLPAAIIYMWGPALATIADFAQSFEGSPSNLLP